VRTSPPVVAHVVSSGTYVWYVAYRAVCRYVCPGRARRYDGTTVASPATHRPATTTLGQYACVPSAISPPRTMLVAAVRSNAAV
jgi:hypothetical protein